MESIACSLKSTTCGDHRGARVWANIGGRIRPGPRHLAPSHQAAPMAPTLIQLRVLWGPFRPLRPLACIGTPSTELASVLIFVSPFEGDRAHTFRARGGRGKIPGRSLPDWSPPRGVQRHCFVTASEGDARALSLRGSGDFGQVWPSWAESSCRFWPHLYVLRPSLAKLGRMSASVGQIWLGLGQRRPHRPTSAENSPSAAGVGTPALHRRPLG